MVWPAVAIRKVAIEQGEEATVVGNMVCRVEDHHTQEWASASIAHTGPQMEGLVTWEVLARAVEEGPRYASGPFGSRAGRAMSLRSVLAGVSRVDAPRAVF